MGFPIGQEVRGRVQSLPLSPCAYLGQRSSLASLVKKRERAREMAAAAVWQAAQMWVYLSLSGRRRRLLFLPVYTSVLKLPPLRDSSGFSSAHARFRFFRKHSHFSLSSDAGKFMRACLLARLEGKEQRGRERASDRVLVRAG